jgi:diguanylate cyclase (GGDEF)-like protein/PAS domain S-box-containing protein
MMPSGNIAAPSPGRAEEPADRREETVVQALPSAERLSVFAHAPVGVALATPTGIVIDANPALCHMLALPAEALHGRPVLDLVHPAAQAAAREAHAALLTDRHRPLRHETRLAHGAGHDLPVQVTTAWVDGAEAGTPPHLILVIEDIADRKELEAQLLHRSLHDPLTGLPNRLLFRDRFRHALERGFREHTPTCLLIVDLDGFKEVNDTLGHPAGDRVLVAFAERVQAGLRASDTAARLGGDEFGVLCEDTDRPEAEVLAGRLRAAIGAPLVLDGAELRLGASIGIGVVPGGTAPEDAYERVVREADDAMYAVKRRQE